jgi:membrane fusion protein (multidrug efflux system)
MSGYQWVVTRGLNEGTRIVVDGVQKAKPGATVKPVDPARPAASEAAPSAAVPASAASQQGR